MSKQHFNNNLYEGHKGKVMLELSKTYKGDSRFKLDQRFKDDIEVEKLPQKFKDIAEKGLIEKMEKKKKIKKDKPLIIQRFQPGTVQAENNIKKAEGKKKYEEGLRRHHQKVKKKAMIEKGIDKVRKAQLMLDDETGNKDKQQGIQTHQFKITINGNRKQAFKQSNFKLFG